MAVSRAGPARVDAGLRRRPGATRARLAALHARPGRAGRRASTRPAVLANHLAFLQLDLVDPELHAVAAEHSRLVRHHVTRARCRRALATGELGAVDPGARQDRCQTTYNGALVTWAVDGRGSLAAWLRREVEAVLAPHRRPAARPGTVVVVIAVEDAQAIVMAACRPLAARAARRCATPSAASWPSDVVAAEIGAALRQHRRRRLRRAGRRHRRRPRRAGRASACSPPAPRPTSRSAPGQALRIMTGAPLPDGADAVVMVEDSEVARRRPGAAHPHGVAVGDAVRRAGDDVRAGDVVLDRRHRRCGPAHLGVLASIGVLEVPVYPRARVGVLSTGDELVEGGGPLRPGPDPRVEPADAPRPSSPRPAPTPSTSASSATTRPRSPRRSSAAAATCDALVTSGGVSMGDFDVVKVVLDRVGRMRWMQVAIKPAKPFAFGLLGPEPGGTPVFGLPGNPVSSLVSFELFARPALRQMMGHADAGATRGGGRRRRRLAPPPRRQGPLHRGSTARFEPDGRFHVRSTGAQGSHQLAATAAANGLAVLPDGDGVEPGGDVRVLLLGPLPSDAHAPGDPRRREVVFGRGGPYAATHARGPHDLVDPFGRTIRDLRISITDRCNFRCTYCMPAEGMQWLPREDLLTFEELERLARIFVERFNVDGIRLTGGEPTVRAHLPVLVAKLAALGCPASPTARWPGGKPDLSVTTNGATFRLLAHELRAAGLDRVNISLDSLRRDRFLAITRRDDLDKVLDGIDAAIEAGFDAGEGQLRRRAGRERRRDRRLRRLGP